MTALSDFQLRRAASFGCGWILVSTAFTFWPRRRAISFDVQNGPLIRRALTISATVWPVSIYVSITLWPWGWSRRNDRGWFVRPWR